MTHPGRIYITATGKKRVVAAQRKKPQDTHAVSPVVGVMLMLIVTVVIAAVVSGLSGGFSEAPRPAPSALFDVHIYAQEGLSSLPGFYTPDITISEISGDAIPTKDLRITTTYTNNTETTFAGNLIGEVSVSGPANGQYSGVLVIYNGSQMCSVVSSSPSGNPQWFGDAAAVITPGQSLTTAAQAYEACGYYNINGQTQNPIGNPGMNYLLGFDVANQETSGGFGRGSVVEVRIFHTPSGKMLLDKIVNVE